MVRGVTARLTLVGGQISDASGVYFDDAAIAGKIVSPPDPNKGLPRDGPGPAERREALCGKGDIFYEMGASDAQNYRRSIELYEQLAAEPGVPAHWRNQAEFKKGKALEKLNDTPAALTSYYGVIEEGMRSDRQREFFWFYKAGFNAAHLLEETNDWKSAVAVYRKLAAVGGTRSDEARARLTQLRLEHFLWDE